MNKEIRNHLDDREMVSPDQIRKFWDFVSKNNIYDDADMTNDNQEELDIVSARLKGRSFKDIFVAGTATLCREIEIFKVLNLKETERIIINDIIENFLDISADRLAKMISLARIELKKILWRYFNIFQIKLAYSKLYFHIGNI